MDALNFVVTELLMPAITLIVGFFAGRRKQNREADSVALENIDKAVNIYKSMLDDMKLRYDMQIQFLNAKIESQQRHIEALEIKLANHLKHIQ
jgi:hypothetical protein